MSAAENYPVVHVITNNAGRVCAVYGNAEDAKYYPDKTCSVTPWQVTGVVKGRADVPLSSAAQPGEVPESRVLYGDEPIDDQSFTPLRGAPKRELQEVEELRAKLAKKESKLRH